MSVAQEKTSAEIANSVKDMKDIVALCKRRGFVFPASDIYGGLNGFWDYGPLGVELKNNLRDLWWKWMVTCPPVGPDGQPVDIVGIDSSIIQNPKTWEASGHVGGFSDPMVDCRETKLRYRADHLSIIYWIGETFAVAIFDDWDEDTIAKRLKKLGVSKKIGDAGYTRIQGIQVAGAGQPGLDRTYGPDAKEIGTLTEPKQFNLMFHTFVGATGGDDNKAYLRPETAQGIFLNFKNVLDSSRVRVPFGIAQVGKAFRNEVNPRNFIFRSREFEQMEMEWFCHPSEAKMWRDFWFAERQKFWTAIGLVSENVRMRDHDKDELSHYAKEGLGTADIEYRFPFTAPGFGELEGIAHRCNFDLTQHQKHSGVKMEYTDPMDPKNKFIPDVIEPAAGLTRGVLALLCEAYTPDPNRPSGVYLNLHPALAPKKAAILPLTAKDQHPVIATKLYMDIRNEFAVDLDIKQNIGKRYARQDEIGTPYCFTIDDQTVSDQTVTVRERNTMSQERIGLDHVAEYLRKHIRSV
ncbi:glycine--tRNA ligase [Micavibrio aeruginosavorus]|uniref:glycine--tRNA ligase n=1 Tax=Micavibrio aeruginosavorus EPB TaxID=349215 RepID=M4VZ60_9BACT|nr:glycine--tRNA ligase [Micavibrio aeruginosavorus]AGH98459.1 Glycyl-tRNA synthetase [Micavibrio aeruginosavorus EPB]